MITVFTPAYNRGKFLPKIHGCLCKQTFREFEWVIVDDGSVDDTKETVESLIDDNQNFPIRYFCQENGGKHRAVNRGVQEAKGELFLILDSDDTLPEDSLEVIHRYYLEIKEQPEYGGVCGCMAHHNGERIGSGLANVPEKANSIELRNRYHVQGDLCEVLRTSVLKEFPFPEIEGERFCSELLFLNRIATKYSLRCFDEVVYYRDYIHGGLTDNIVKIRMNSPVGTLMTYSELSSYDIPLILKMRAVINYYRFYYCLKNGKAYPRLPKKWMFLRPLGWLAHHRDVRRINQVKK